MNALVYDNVVAYSRLAISSSTRFPTHLHDHPLVQILTSVLPRLQRVCTPYTHTLRTASQTTTPHPTVLQMQGNCPPSLCLTAFPTSVSLPSTTLGPRKTNPWQVLQVGICKRRHTDNSLRSLKQRFSH